MFTFTSRCPKCQREFHANVKGEYCPECWVKFERLTQEGNLFKKGGSS